MADTAVFPFPSVRVVPWIDPLTDRVGHDPRSPYVERCWTGVLGPTTLLLLRRIADHFDAHPEGFELPLADTAAALGLGSFGGRNSPFARALQRTAQFGLARFGTTGMAVRRRVPPLSQRQLDRLPDDVRRAHLAWVHHPSARPALADCERVTGAAMSLLGLGDDPELVVRQLVSWGVERDLARVAVTAAGEHADDDLPPAA